MTLIEFVLAFLMALGTAAGNGGTTFEFGWYERWEDGSARLGLLYSGPEADNGIGQRCGPIHDEACYVEVGIDAETREIEVTQTGP